MNVGRLRITYQLLAAILRLPEGASITAIVPQTAEDVVDQKLALIVTGPGLPKHMEGAPIENVGVQVNTDGSSHFT